MKLRFEEINKFPVLVVGWHPVKRTSGSYRLLLDYGSKREFGLPSWLRFQTSYDLYCFFTYQEILNAIERNELPPAVIRSLGYYVRLPKFRGGAGVLKLPGEPEQ